MPAAPCFLETLHTTGAVLRARFACMFWEVANTAESLVIFCAASLLPGRSFSRISAEQPEVTHPCLDSLLFYLLVVDRSPLGRQPPLADLTAMDEESCWKCSMERTDLPCHPTDTQCKLGASCNICVLLVRWRALLYRTADCVHQDIPQA